jgi:NAD+ kinase
MVDAASDDDQMFFSGGAMRIGLYVNPEKDPSYGVARRTADLIASRGATCVAAPEFGKTGLAGSASISFAEYATCDVLISQGGDGTFLSTVHLPGCENIPVIGVNLGSVGFLPEILPEQLEAAIDQLIAGQYHIGTRMMLSVSCYDSKQNLLEEGFALNDAVISRGGRSRIVTLELTINREIVEYIPGDGLIVATPTGSTAYSLSSGGPIVHPELSLMLITPICPHTLHNRSYITSDSSRVVVRICEVHDQALLAIDGRQEIYLDRGSSVVIGRSERSLKLIRLGNDDFYAILPQKIQARGRTR